jgi:hypothetical protein
MLFPAMCEQTPLRILIYQPVWGTAQQPAAPGCEFLYDRSRWQEADAVLFHIPQLARSRFPPRKLQNQLWVGWCMESEVNYPMLAQRSELAAVFDLWMTYQQDSDIWCPYFSKRIVEALRGTPAPKTASSPAVALISSRFDESGRIGLLEALMREMPIDSYGKIHRNRPEPIERTGEAKRALISRYRFTLAFENSICKDYVTEKFFDPLIAGSVPVYLGAPNVEDFAPGDNCYIDATRFDNPRSLAQFLVGLAADENAYAHYLQWKVRPLRRQFAQMLERTGNEFHLLADRVRATRVSRGRSHGAGDR